MIIFLNHRDRLFCDVFETPNNNNDYFTIIIIIGPTINRSDASLKSNRDDDISTQQSTNMFLSALITLDQKHFITDHSHNVI